MPKPLNLTTATALLLSVLAGCATVDSPQVGPKPEEKPVLLERMEACLQQQELLQAHLQLQNDLLHEQGGQLEVVAKQVAELSGESTISPVVSTAPRCPPAGANGDKLLVGGREQVWLPNLGLALSARVDTGAETASLDARDIEQFERNGERWVRFKIVNPETEELIELERKVARRALIVLSNTAERERRPVIKLSITIGHINQTAEFTLSDRSHSDYQLLVGRNILQDVMIVDVSKKNIAPYVADAESDRRAAL